MSQMPSPQVAHLLFEAAAYAVGFTVYCVSRRRHGDFLDDSRRWSLVVAAVLGAAVGSKLLHHLAHPSLWREGLSDPVHLMGGKTIVGGLVGGWIAVEAWKKHAGIRERTGDVYVLPLAVGMMIGRVGCFLGGLVDGTHGVATASVFGVDFGDGVLRHPAQLYEVAFLALLAAAVARPLAAEPRRGDRFRAFILGYLLFRLLIDFLKPVETVAGMGVLQWVCLAALALQAGELPRLLRAFVPAPPATAEASR